MGEEDGHMDGTSLEGVAIVGQIRPSVPAPALAKRNKFCLWNFRRTVATMKVFHRNLDASI